MAGLVVLIFLAVYLGMIRRIALMVAKIIGFAESPMRIFLVGVLLLCLPFVDEMVGRIQFERECRKIEGYEVGDAMRTAVLARYANELTIEEDLATAIPISKSTAFVVDAKSGATLISYATLHTYGGWIMRLGLNMGAFTSCNSINVPEVMQAHGFKWIKNGFFEKFSGR